MKKGHKQSGMTLLEVLVVLLLVAMLSTLLIQGVGYFLGKYEKVRRFQYLATTNTLQQQWFLTSVQGMIAYRQSLRQFKGESDYFTGFTMRPLAAEPGTPVRVQWKLMDVEGEMTLQYREGPKNAWKIRSLPEAKLQFYYSDRQDRWHKQWPPTIPYRDKIPKMIKLAAVEQPPLLLAHLTLHQRPVVDFRE